MSHKTWLTKDAWVSFAACGGDSRFITPPDKLSDDDVQEVQAICHKCVVRPECLKSCVANADTGVWTGSTWIPEVNLSMGKREAAGTLEAAEKVREGLAATVEDELKRRGEF
jgi:hypothetical protein